MDSITSDLIDKWLIDMESPDWIISCGKSFLKIKNIDALGNVKNAKIIQQDVVDYYLNDARNMNSGIRKLSDIIGDWRYIDELAEICVDYFKHIDNNGFEKLSTKNGLII